MYKLSAVLLVLCPVVYCGIARGAEPLPTSIPSAEDLRLTLREDPQSNLPLGRSCSGEAAQTLNCRAFLLALENASAHTIHISGVRCLPPSVIFEREEASGWTAVSGPGQPACKTPEWTNLRLRPGEHTEFATRLAAPGRWIESVGAGRYTLRAKWTLFGCTEMPEGTDCLAPLQTVRQGSSVAEIATQEPVTIYSNEVAVESPDLGDLGELKFALKVTFVQRAWTNTLPDDHDPCAGEAGAGVECTVFHFSIQNLADRPVRNAIFSCNGSGIVPEFRLENTEWKPLPGIGGVCNSDALEEKEILPGATLEGAFTLPTLAPRYYDTSAVRGPGIYHFRFTFVPDACIASSDGSFCLMHPDKQPPAVSNELIVIVPSFAKSGRARSQ